MGFGSWSGPRTSKGGMGMPGVDRRIARAIVGILTLVGLFVFGAAYTSRASGEPASTRDWWARARTTTYAFQSRDTDGRTRSRLGGYQHFDGYLGGLAGDRLSVRLGGRFADDLSFDERVHDRARLYVAYLQTELGPRNLLRARVGRQFLQEGPNNLRYDGLWFGVGGDGGGAFTRGGAPRRRPPSSTKREASAMQPSPGFVFRASLTPSCARLCPMRIGRHAASWRIVPSGWNS